MRIPEREARAERRRATAVLNRTTLGHNEPDLHPLAGAAAVALVDQLTREGWSSAGKPFPVYRRNQIPIRFVRGLR